MKNNPYDITGKQGIAGKRFTNNILLAALSGFLLFLSFPKFGSGYFAWIAFIPLFFALKDAAGISQGLLLGFLTGVTAYIGIIYWIAYVIVHYGYLPLYVGIILMLLLACYLSLYVSLFAAGLVYFRDKIPLYLTAPVLWVCFEYGKSFFLTGFPWENLGYSQYLNRYLIQSADVVGVFGLSFILLLVNATIFEVISKKSKKEYIVAGCVFLVIVSVLVYGVYRVNHVNQILRSAKGLDVYLVQGNIEQAIKWDKKYKKETLDIYERLSLKHAPDNGSLIVWPETAVPFKFQVMNDLHEQIVHLSVKTKSWLLFGSVSSLPYPGGHEFFNSAYLLSPSGDVRGKYDKVHLVPYGEYVPLRNVMPFVEGFTEGIGDFSQGPGFYPLTMDDKKIGVLICYEGILAHASRQYKNNAAELLVNITNDAWFGNTSAPFQHFSMSVFRAVETRLYLVRAANTGVSGIVDPTGKIIAATDIFQKDAIKGAVKFVRIPTLYDRFGDIFVVFCFAFVVLYFIRSLMWRRKNDGRKHTGNSH